VILAVRSDRLGLHQRIVERKSASDWSRAVKFHSLDAYFRYFQMFRPPRPVNSKARKITPGITKIGEATPIMIPRENPNSHMAIGVTMAIINMTQYLSFIANHHFMSARYISVNQCNCTFPTSPAVFSVQIQQNPADEILP
jgi:hypothetical protein